MSVTTLDKPLKSSAAGQYLGYSLQQLRFCYHLLCAPDGDFVSFEYLDDTAIHKSDGTYILEQSKSALSSNPASDKSKDLWKTFANWSNLCTDGVIDHNSTIFRYYISPQKSGELINSLHSAKSEEEISTLLTRIAKLVNKKTPNVGCSPFVTEFLTAGDVVCKEIIRRFELVQENDPVECIRQCVRIGAPSDVVNEIASATIGMARDRVDNLIRRHQPTMVSSQIFRQTYQTFLQRYNLTGILPSRSSAPSPTIISELVTAAPTFVRQLQAVDASHSLIVTAVSDYMRATSDKTYWADEGLILDDSIEELDLKLLRRFEIVRDEVEDTLSEHDEKRRGREVYRRCSETVVPLEGRVLPDHFIAGEFNDLSDQRMLGWHPEYSKLFPRE